MILTIALTATAVLLGLAVSPVGTWAYQGYRSSRQYASAHAEAKGLDDEATSWLIEFDANIKLFGIDTSHPEVIEARKLISSYPTQPDEGVGFFISLAVTSSYMNPVPFTQQRADGSLFIAERPGFAVGFWSPHFLADHNLGQGTIAKESSRITVDKEGTHFFMANGDEVVCFQTGACDPYRLADDGNRLRNAADIVRTYTGLALTTVDGSSFFGQFKVELERLDSGWDITWRYGVADEVRSNN
jgi:hypothetical protein